MQSIDPRPLILGAGPAGATAALFLAKQGIGSMLLDKASFPRDKICGDALSGKVVELLTKLDPSLRHELQANATAYQPSWGVRFVAPNGKSLKVPFTPNYDPTTQPAPGYISKRLDFDNWLLAKAIANPLVDYRPHTEVKTLRHISGGIEATLADGSSLTTPILLAADGAQSVAAKQLHGFQVIPKDYCAGIRQYWSGVQGLDPEGFIELHFLRELLPGYLWIFPLPNGEANVGLGIRSDVVSRKKLNLKTLLPQVIANHPELKQRFASAQPLESIKGFGLPLGTKQRSISGEHYLLLGDAASLIDPFTGEGIGNAMFSGMYAAQTAATALASGDYKAATLASYDKAVYRRLWDELKLGRTMQRLVEVPWLFNLVVNKAQHSKTLQETISVMFTDLDLRDRLRSPAFYAKLLFN